MTRIQVTGGPWPERVGMTGHIVPPPPGPPAYPWHGLGRQEAVVYLPDDDTTHLLLRPVPDGTPYTCVLNARHYKELPA